MSGEKPEQRMQQHTHLDMYNRLEAEKQSIQAERSSLIKENKEKKQRLEELERDLKEMLSKSDAISQRFESAKEEADAVAVVTAAAD